MVNIGRSVVGRMTARWSQPSRNGRWTVEPDDVSFADPRDRVSFLPPSRRAHEGLRDLPVRVFVGFLFAHRHRRWRTITRILGQRAGRRPARVHAAGQLSVNRMAARRSRSIASANSSTVGTVVSRNFNPIIR